MPRKLRMMAGVLAATLFTACDFFEGDCVAVPSPGIHATIVDATTGQSPTVPVLMRIEEGSYVEEVREATRYGGSSKYQGAYQREGTYRVTVTAAGYQAFQLNNVRVRAEGHCDVLVGGALDIALVRLPALSAAR